MSPPQDGTTLAINDTDIGGLHGPAEARKRRRQSTSLRVSDCEKVILGAEHAHLIGAPLNRFLTIHFGAAGIDDPVTATRRLLKLIRDWLRCYNRQVTAVWVRETDFKKGEHVHILLSIPPNKITPFNRMQRAWFARIGAPWKRGVYQSKPIGGSYLAAFNPLTVELYQTELRGTLEYILKGADAKARAKFGLERQGDGGELWGKRAGTTENIGRTARLRKIGSNRGRATGRGDPQLL